jgi:hypothetical protein
VDIAFHRLRALEIAFGQLEHEHRSRGVRKEEVVSRCKKIGKRFWDFVPLNKSEQEDVRRDKAKDSSFVCLLCVESEDKSFKNRLTC